MSLTQENLQAIHGLLIPVIGREAWGAEVSDAGRLTVNFGVAREETMSDGRSFTRGEWLLWTTGSSWRLTAEYEALAESEDPDPSRQAAVARLNGRRLLSIDIVPITETAIFAFDDGLLRIDNVYLEPREDPDLWMFLLPDGDKVVLQ